MKLKISTNYTTEKTKDFISEQDCFNELKSYLEEYVEDYNSVEISDIENLINDFIWMHIDNEDIIDKNDIVDLNEVNYCDLLNMNEISEQFKYLLKKDTQTCCDKNSLYNYCPICGKKLK